MRKATNGIHIVHYLKISVAIHALVHGFKFMILKWLVLNILKAWHGGESLTLMLLLSLVLWHLMLTNSGCRSPTKNSRSTCPCILNMAINYHVYFLHDIFLLFLFNALLILIPIATKAISISSSSLILSSFWRILMNCLARSS